MKTFFASSLALSALLATQNCSESPGKQPAVPIQMSEPAPMALPSGFNEYWYAGQAEICSYDVSQERYGEIRQAEQVNVFVTEELSKSKQVKLDNPAAVPDDRTAVLKLNLIRRFQTGIYDYSIMQSVFTPVSGSPTLKTTTTVQDWCGHVFAQYNLVPNGYRLRGFSYFESEGDQEVQLPLALLEDELWSRIRLNPASIQSGQTKIIPAALYARLRHQTNVVQNADIQIDKGEKESILKLKYTDIPRTLEIRFETAFPHKILGWEEQIQGKMASKGTLKASRKSAYWAEHDNIHAPLRDSLQLGF